MADKKPIIMASSWPPRKCGIATFAEEALEFIQKQEPDRPCYTISHTDGAGDNVFPIIDMDREDWYKPVADKIHELDPYVVHLQHEYGLYNYVDENGESDLNQGFLRLLEEIEDVPRVVEPHTVHGRMKDHEEEFVHKLAPRTNMLFLKCRYQKWRLEWNFSAHKWDLPRNIMIIPHGARPDRRYAIDEVSALKDELGLGHLKDKHVIGLVGWIQRNKRWDIVTDMWEDICDTLREKTGKEWVLLAAGDLRDPHDIGAYAEYMGGVKVLAEKGLADFFKFTPRGVVYYKVMAICDFVLLPSLDETQSGTLARIMALNKPFVTTAPLEGLTAQTLESEGGLLFTNKDMLRQKIIRLATDEGLRWKLGHNLYQYLMNVISWEVVARQYFEAYEMANAEVHENQIVDIRPEF
ncbi:MAG: glycosyltransferase [Planctomycetes bacterium]|nr:glycosyltransferase [Planctomycetota bacterium]